MGGDDHQAVLMSLEISGFKTAIGSFVNGNSAKISWWNFPSTTLTKPSYKRYRKIKDLPEFHNYKKKHLEGKLCGALMILDV